jgi:hypothetical protein
MDLDYRLAHLKAMEAFLRSASLVDAPFMLKGSLVTRQYLKDPSARFAVDLDWVYLEYLDDRNKAENIFSKWLKDIAHARGTYGYRFKADEYWAGLDYAMADDFPTISTYVKCYRHDEFLFNLKLDISFNLEILYDPKSLLYRPEGFIPFLIKKTCPLALQVSWKLHQTLARSRVKDFYDLIQLLKHEAFNEEELKKAILALRKECWNDDIPVSKLQFYLEDTAINICKEKEENRLPENWYDIEPYSLQELYYNLTALNIISLESIQPKEAIQYTKMSELLLDFQQALIDAGFTKDLLR